MLDPTVQPVLDTPDIADEPEVRPGGIPLYVWVVIAAVLGVVVGEVLLSYPNRTLLAFLEFLPRVIIKLIKALATPLIVLAILSALVTNDIKGRQGARMMLYYLVNTIIAITIGLVLSNLLKPGVGATLPATPTASSSEKPQEAPDGFEAVMKLVEEMIPVSIADAFARNNLAQLVVVTLALGIGLIQIRNEQYSRAQSAKSEPVKSEHSVDALILLITVTFELMMRVLLWVVALVPLAVFGVVASNIARFGFSSFQSLLWFIVVVLVGLACQISWYLIQLFVFARMAPLRFLFGAKDVMATTFSTASTGATMPVTLRALTGKLGVSRTSAQLAACVGTNFNNDGTALYQAAVVLFLSQAMGASLSLPQQLIVVLTTVIASIGAGNIPSGSFITLPLIFAAVGLPTDQLPIILTIDWFLDRCRTTSNVLGDMTVAVLLDQTADKSAPVAEATG